MYSLKYEDYASSLGGCGAAEFTRIVKTLDAQSLEAHISPDAVSELADTPLHVTARLMETLSSGISSPLHRRDLFECVDCSSLLDEAEEECICGCSDKSTCFRFVIRPDSDYGRRIALRELVKFAPGNALVLDKLVERLIGGEVVGFLGAGASAELYPGWNGLVERFLEHALASGYATDAQAEAVRLEGSPHQKAEKIASLVGHPTVKRLIKETFAPSPKRFSAAMVHIVALPLRGIITTNYDISVLHALQECGASSFREGTWQDDETLRDWIQGSIFGAGVPVLFTHGRYDKPDSVVFTLTDYEKAYEGTAYRNFFRDISLRYNLLFIGYSFSDLFMQILSRQDQRGQGQVTPSPNHIAFLGVDPSFEYDRSVRAQYANDYGVEVIFYPNTNRHAVLLDVLGLMREEANSNLSV